MDFLDRNGFTQVPNWFLQVPTAVLTFQERSILAWYASHSEDFIPCQKTLYQQLGMSEKGLSKIIRSLRSKGFLVQNGTNKYGSAVYIFAGWETVKMDTMKTMLSTAKSSTRTKVPVVSPTTSTKVPVSTRTKVPTKNTKKEHQPYKNNKGSGSCPKNEQHGKTEDHTIKSSNEKSKDLRHPSLSKKDLPFQVELFRIVKEELEPVFCQHNGYIRGQHFKEMNAFAGKLARVDSLNHLRAFARHLANDTAAIHFISRSNMDKIGVETVLVSLEDSFTKQLTIKHQLLKDEEENQKKFLDKMLVNSKKSSPYVSRQTEFEPLPSYE